MRCYTVKPWSNGFDTKINLAWRPSIKSVSARKFLLTCFCYLVTICMSNAVLYTNESFLRSTKIGAWSPNIKSISTPLGSVGAFVNRALLPHKAYPYGRPYPYIVYTKGSFFITLPIRPCYLNRFIYWNTKRLFLGWWKWRQKRNCGAERKQRRQMAALPNTIDENRFDQNIIIVV